MIESTDPMNPEVSVDGLGTYDLKTLKNNTKRNIESLMMAAGDGINAREWRKVKNLLDSGVIQTKVDAIISAYDDLEARRQRGGPNSRGIDRS